MNVVVFMGRLTADPDIRFSNEGKAVARFSIAVDRRFKREGEADADFFNCVAFGKTAEFMERYFHKGMRAVVTGELRNNHYEKDGVKHYSEQIIVNTVEFAESKQSNDTPAPAPQDNFIAVSETDLDELPFN